jgi:hypothetical protein
MAFTAVVPTTLNVNVRQGAAQQFKSSAVNNPAGTAVDLSAWTALACKAIPSAPGPTSQDYAFGTVTADANGIITLLVADDDFTADQIGTAGLVIVGKPTSGDVLQLLATGSLQVQGG